MENIRVLFGQRPNFCLSILLSFFVLIYVTGISGNACLADELSTIEQSPAVSCKIKALQKLGWTISFVDSPQSFIIGGNPCDDDTLAEAVQNGELRMSVSKTQGIREVVELLEKAIDSNPSYCAYKHAIREPVKTAITKLHDNENYGFAGNFNFCNPGGDEWREVVSGNKCMVAKSSGAAAIRCFYDRPCRSECAVGLQIAWHAFDLELLGDETFDKLYKPEEVAIGTWSNVASRSGIFYGSQGTGGESIINLGATAFIGAGGYIGNVRAASGDGRDERKYLDRPSDRGENFMITGMSQKAAADLKDLGGLKALNPIFKSAWEAYVKAKKSLPEDEALRNPVSMKLLNIPAITETKVYVHPLGELTLWDHIYRLFQVNPDTPYGIELYNLKGDRPNEDSFDRYLSHLEEEC